MRLSIYKVWCTKTQLVYVGHTADVTRRLQQHERRPPARMKAGAAKYQPFRQYFKLVVLAACTSPSMANHLESLYICQFNSTQSGYNNLKGPPTKTAKFWALERHRRKG